MLLRGIMNQLVHAFHNPALDAISEQARDAGTRINGWRSGAVEVLAVRGIVYRVAGPDAPVERHENPEGRSPREVLRQVMEA